MPLSLRSADDESLPEEATVAFIDDGEGPRCLVDAVYDPQFCLALYGAIVEGREMLGRTGAVWSHARVADLDLGDADTMPRLQQTAQGETFIQYGPDLTLKLFRNIEPGTHPDLELRRYLTDRTSFENLSPVYGALEYQSRDTFSLGMMQKNLDPEITAWTLFRDLCLTYLEQIGDVPAPGEVPVTGWLNEDTRTAADVSEALDTTLAYATTLGVTTAEFHQALATQTEEPELRPAPVTSLYQRSLYQSLRAGVKQELTSIRNNFEQAPDDVRSDLETLLGAESAMLTVINRVRQVPASGRRTRIHGNYRLDELRLIDNEFYMLDLSGDHTRPISERRLKAPPLRDVAEMIRSFHYAALAAARSSGRPDAVAHAERWYRMLGERFVGAYVEAATGSPVLPTEDESIEALLVAFELSKALREVEWELVQRPEMVWIALRGALRLIQ
jgi:trehalose synthase-fused probable maltokinase